LESDSDPSRACTSVSSCSAFNSLNFSSKEESSSFIVIGKNRIVIYAPVEDSDMMCFSENLSSDYLKKVFEEIRAYNTNFEARQHCKLMVGLLKRLLWMANSFWKFQ